MSNPFADQARFMEACGQTTLCHNTPQFVMYETLIKEEYEEWIGALDDTEGADAVVDLIVVLIGYALSKGWPIEALWNEVMRSNLAKIDPVTGLVRRREDGKVMKPPGWQAPDIANVLARGNAE